MLLIIERRTPLFVDTGDFAMVRKLALALVAATVLGTAAVADVLISGARIAGCALYYLVRHASRGSK